MTDDAPDSIRLKARLQRSIKKRSLYQEERLVYNSRLAAIGVRVPQPYNFIDGVSP